MSLTQVYLGLGSNVEREKHLLAGLEALSGFLQEMRCSAVFESQPVGIKSGPFFNLVVSAKTDLPLVELSRRLKLIEVDNGRYAQDRLGLPLDIDVLFYGDLVGNFDGLTLPRAEILKNAFHLFFAVKSTYEVIAVSIMERVSVRNHINTVPGMKWNTDFMHDLMKVRSRIFFQGVL
mgnify:CR=1 FL=1